MDTFNFSTIKRFAIITLLTIAFVISIVVSVSFSWGLGMACENLLIFLAYPVLCLTGIILMFLASWLLKQEKGRRLKRFYQICKVSVALMFVSIPIGLFRDDVIFNLRAADYEKVVEMVEVKEIRADVFRYAELPQRYGYLTACQRKIAIEQDNNVTKVLFFTYRGMMGEVGGYLYRSDGLPPQDDDFVGIGAGGMSYSEERPNWYSIYID